MHGGGTGAEWVIAGVAGAALFVALLALRSNWRANRIPWVFSFLTEYERREPDRRYIVNHLTDDHADPSQGIPAADPGHREVISVIHYLNQLGFLVASGVVRVGDVAAVMGPSVVHMWTILEPYVEGEREKRRKKANRDPAYGEFFERLAERIETLTPKAARRRVLDPTPCERFTDWVSARR
jgi:hypothetical protein